jgi:hypothetical protein
VNDSRFSIVAVVSDSPEVKAREFKVDRAGVLFVTEGLSVCHFSWVVPGTDRVSRSAHFPSAAILPNVVTQLAPGASGSGG